MQTWFSGRLVKTMNNIQNLIAAGQALLWVARKLDEEGNTPEARKMYRRALRQGLRVRKRKRQAGFGDELRLVTTGSTTGN
jgi:hypothetical protein